MFEEQVTIQNPTGFHARPAALLAQFCKDFSEAIIFYLAPNVLHFHKGNW